MAFDERGFICMYNSWCRCMIADCDFCGWNPTVSEKRLEDILQNLGVDKQKVQMRLIDAIDTVDKIGKQVAPMLERDYSPRKIYSEVMKCIAAAPTIDAVGVVHGYWEFGKWEGGHWVDGNERCRCSVCGRDFAVDNQNIWNGCPHCLAKMDGETP